ncbi:MAG: DUF6662 family protein [Bdellovibrionota bacterium]
MKNVIFCGAGLCAALLAAGTAHADERMFTYSYEADVLPKDQLEFEHWTTLRADKDNGDFTAWDFREELEYGLTDRLTTAAYLNFTSEYVSPKDESEEEENKVEFEGISSEWKYQILNPNLDPIGIVAYLEGTYSGEEAELEEKLIISKPVDDFVFAFNTVLEQEWEFEHGETNKEQKLELTFGASYKITPEWAVGLEARNDRVFAGDIHFSDQENSSWFLGPNIHYGAPKWWATFTVFPQIWGNGEGTRHGLQLEEHERIEARLLVGYLF